MVNLLRPWLQTQVDQLRQLNLSGDKKRRDLGGFLLLMCFVTLRRTWWQVAPLLEELVPEQPMLTLGFMQEAKHSGVWDRWGRVTKQYHKERAGMLKAAEGPVFSIAGLLPAHLIVARLLEPVHEALKNGKQPDDVLQSQIWRFAGQLLLDVPNCPVQLSDAVHSLMGTEPPAQDSLASPVTQASDRQTHISQALDAISLTAQTMRQQQQSQPAQQQSNVFVQPGPLRRCAARRVCAWRSP